MPFGRFWAESGLVATFCLPVPRVWSSNPTEANMEPNEFNLWGRQLQQIHHKIVTFVFLLLLVALSISFLVCWYLLSFHVACFFSLCCQVFCLLRLTLEGCATNTEPNTYRKISHDLFLEVFWFQFFPHHRPGTWIVFKMWAQHEVKIGSAESH